VATAGAGVLWLVCASEAAPKPPKAGAAAGDALFCIAPPKLNSDDDEAGAGVLAGAAELVAPNWKAGALVLAGAAEAEAPNWKLGVLGAAGSAGVKVLAPKVKVGCEAGAGKLGAATDELAPPKEKAGVDAPLVVPNMLVDGADELVSCCAPPKGVLAKAVLAGWAPKMEAPKDVDAPFVGGAPPLKPPNGLFVDDAGEKSKLFVGGWKPLLWFAAPNVGVGAGKELLVKALFELALEACAGGKLFVVLAPNAPPNMPVGAFAPLSPPPPMGAEAPKLKPVDGWAPLKFTLCERPCGVALAVRWFRMCRVRTALRCARLYFSTMFAAVDAIAVVRAGAGVGAGAGAGAGREDLRTRRLVCGEASQT
jgi:hypothetical protein